MEDLLQCCVCGAVFNQTKVYLEDEDHQYNVPPFFFSLVVCLTQTKKRMSQNAGFSDPKNPCGVFFLGFEAPALEAGGLLEVSEKVVVLGPFRGVSAILGVQIWEIFFASKIPKKKCTSIDLK